MFRMMTTTGNTDAKRTWSDTMFIKACHSKNGTYTVFRFMRDIGL